MLRSLLLILIVSSSLNVYANPRLADVVLGVDYTAFNDENPYTFPCHSYMDVMFCDNYVVIEDKSCSSSVSIQTTGNQRVVSCTLASGEEFVIGQTDKDPKLTDDSTQAAGYYRLNYSPRVELKQGNNQHTLVIK